MKTSRPSSAESFSGQRGIREAVSGPATEEKKERERTRFPACPRMKYRIYQTDAEGELVQATYRNSQALFLKMRDLATARGARFMVLLIPAKFQVARDVLLR
ncbi:MAG: hypothetical protein AAF657_20315, partial [Acidobacteriota bacterium]